MHYRRKVVVTLEPGDVISMRLSGTRKTVSAQIDVVYRQMIMWNVNAQKAKKAADRKAKRKGIRK